MTDDDRPPLDERWTTERVMRTGVPEGVMPFPDTMPDPVDLALALDRLDALAASARPTFTVSGAAEATGKSRRTIARMLDADALPGATRDDSGAWCIPAEALLAAGLEIHAPKPPSEPQEATRVLPKASDTIEAHLLAEWQRRAEVAEAIGVERERIIQAQEMALHALMAAIDHVDHECRPNDNVQSPARESGSD
jgi:hypothetical protein